MLCKQVTRIATPEALPGRYPAHDLQCNPSIVMRPDGLHALPAQTTVCLTKFDESCKATMPT